MKWNLPHPCFSNVCWVIIDNVADHWITNFELMYFFRRFYKQSFTDFVYETTCKVRYSLVGFLMVSSVVSPCIMKLSIKVTCCVSWYLVNGFFGRRSCVVECLLYWFDLFSIIACWLFVSLCLLVELSKLVVPVSFSCITIYSCETMFVFVVFFMGDYDFYVLVDF